MTRSKLHVVECNDEYMTEEHIEHENTMCKDVESSHVQPSSRNVEEGLNDSDDEEYQVDDTVANEQDENGETTKRGRTRLKETWNLPKGQRIVVQCNDINQPIGKEAARLGNFLGTVARNGKLFLYPPRMEKIILKKIGDRWREHKSNLKALYFDANKSMEANNTNVPKGVIKDQWITLVSNWMTPKAQKYPHRAVLYIHTHKHKSDKKMNEQVVDLKERIAENPSLVDTSTGKTAWKGDVLNAVLGADKPGHIHGLGRVSDPNQVFDVSTSRHFQNIHVSSLQDTSNEDLLAIRLKMEKLENKVEKQDAEILELKAKNKNSEGQISASRDVPSIAKANSKRKVCVFRKSKKTFLKDMEMQPSYKRPSMDESDETLVHDENVQQEWENTSANKNKHTSIRGENVQQEKENSSANKVTALHIF
ncbi:hypothetical protein D1007_57884 [Hordeum vulgare]|nr:hypothetical protein D1007_57884 [Hordeum vulgare]